VAVTAKHRQLDHVDLSLRISKEEEVESLAQAQRRLLHLRLLCGGQLGDKKLGPPVMVVFEGWDASGKGGAIRRLVAPLDPRHVRVAQFGAPSHDELRHHFLWRFFPALPGWGGMTIFDRSWYGRVLVERVESLCSEADWMRAYGEINDFEEQLAEAGGIVVKFWLTVTPEEQLARFKARETSPFKSFKLTAEDWRNRDKAPEYDRAVCDMIDRTNTAVAPWVIVPANDKYFARVMVLKTLCERIEAAV
jgi:polyphosphate kinase 2 (PPK2 family)